MMHCPQTNTHKARQWIPQKLDQVVRFFFSMRTIPKGGGAQCSFLYGKFFVFWQATAPTPTPSLEIGIRGVPAARLSPGMPVGMSDARSQMACPGHGRRPGGGGGVMCALFQYWPKQEIETLMREQW